MLNQKGVIHLLLPILLLIGIGITVYLVTSGKFNFFSKAAILGTSAEFVSSSGEPISSTSSRDVKLKLTYVAPTPTPTPTPTPQPSIAPQSVKTMVIQYVPPGGVGTVYPEAEVQDPTSFMKNTVIPAMTNGTKYHGYSNSSTPATINFTLADEDLITETNPPPTRPDNYLSFPPKADNQPGYLDVPAIFTKYNLCDVAKQKDIKFITFIMADYGVYGPKGFEDYITGTKGIPTNGPQLTGSQYCDDKTIMISTFVYTRGLAEALESYGHSLEGIFGFFKGSEYTNWSDRDSCGNDHNPPNSRFEYDRANTANVQSDCRNWKADNTGAQESINCSAWDCDKAKWLVWWMQNMPAEWWKYVIDLETLGAPGTFSSLSANLCGSKATFNYSYSGAASSFAIDMGADPNSFSTGSGIYFNFASGTSSPIIETNVSKMGQYTVGRNMSWRVKTSGGGAISPVQTATVISTCPTPTPNPTPIATFPSHFRVSNDQAGLTVATEQIFDANGKVIDWTLSDGAGLKTVYIQFKLNNAWLEALTGTITYSPPTPTPSPTPTPTPEPAPISLTANPLSITKKGVVTLTWTFNEKLSGCTFSRDANGITMVGGWSGKLSKAELTLGSHTKKLTLSNTSKIVRTTTFNITCKIADIVHGASAVVTVQP